MECSPIFLTRRTFGERLVSICIVRGVEEGGRVDQLDRRILVGLQREGRKTNVALSRQLDLSTAATLSRVKRLVESGAIRGYRAIVDPTALGIAVQAFTLVKLSEHGEQAIREFEQAVKDVVGVRSCYHVAGRFDMIMMLAVCDLDHLAQIIRVDLARIPGVMQLETMLILAESVADEGWPVSPGEMRSADGRQIEAGGGAHGDLWGSGLSLRQTRAGRFLPGRCGLPMADDRGGGWCTRTYGALDGPPSVEES